MPEEDLLGSAESKSKPIQDKENYRNMAEPFASVEEAASAIDAFWSELYTLRNKHRIRDVHVVIECDAIRADGQEGTSLLSAHIGDELREESMVGYAFGQVQAARQDRIAKMMSGKFVRPLPNKK